MDQEGDQQPLLGAEPAGAPGSHRSDPRDQQAEEGGVKERRLPGEHGSKVRYPEDNKAPLRYAAPLGGPRGAILRSLPVLFVLSLIAVVVGVYLTYHIAPLLQQHEADREAFSRGLGELIAMSVLLAMFLTCFLLSVFVRPGRPDESDAEIVEQQAAEMKSSGGVRVCKWCALPKPDRTHHCRVCRSCVLRMDHHCPWLANCVGWGNHKYFMLLLLYGVLACLFVGATMVESVIRVVGEPKATFEELFALLLGSTVDLLLFLVLLLFGCFHLYLLTKGMTTIEFCEKRLRRTSVQPPPDIWNLGFWRNFNEAFGYNPLLWFLPIDNRRGDGKHFPLSTPEMGLPREDLEPGTASRALGTKSSR